MDKSVYVTKAYLPPREEFDRYLDRIWDSSWLTNMGKLHDELKEGLRAYLGVHEIELFVNGHLALETCIQAYGFPAGAEIITTPFSFASTTHAIVRQGLKPVFCDIRKDDCTIDPEKIEERITEKTAAILPVHVYGNIADVYTIQEIADRHGLKVIYDAAHAFGETLNGIGVGNFGDASMFSFHATKVFNTIEGGAVTFRGREDEFGGTLYKIKNFGITDQEHVEYVGGNAKMNEFQAAMGLCNLKHIDELISARKEIDGIYRKELSSHAAELLNHKDNISYNYSYMPVLIENRDEVFGRLADCNIHARKYFYPCINEYDCYRDRYDPDETPVARDVSRRILTLPIYPDLEHETVRDICRIING